MSLTATVTIFSVLSNSTLAVNLSSLVSPINEFTYFSIVSPPLYGSLSSVYVQTNISYSTIYTSISSSQTSLTVTTASYYSILVNYTPSLNFIGTDYVSYVASLGNIWSVKSYFGIIVQPSGTIYPSLPSMAPIVNNLTVSVTMNTMNNVISLSNSISNWTSNTTLTVTSNATRGTVSALNVSGGTISTTNEYFEYTPSSGFIGIDQFKYQASNSAGLSNIATVTVSVNIPKIICKNGSATVYANTTNNSINLSNYLSNWNSSSFLSIVGLPLHGSAYVNGAAIIYTPTSNFTGEDTISFDGTNSSGSSNIATLTIIVSIPKPICGNVNVLCNKNSTKVIFDY
jgi:hypothetical protein